MIRLPQVDHLEAEVASNLVQPREELALIRVYHNTLRLV